MKYLRFALRKTGSYIKAACDRTADLLSPHTFNPNNEALQAFFRADGNQTLRLNYPLTSDSVVFDLGGYKGEWARDIFCKHGCDLYVFEPVPAFYNAIVSYFSPNPKIKAYDFGLAARDENVSISVDEFSSSIVKTGNEQISIRLKSVMDFISENNIKHVDLIKINIEGAEYELLEALIEHNAIPMFTDIQVQFHDFIPDAKNRMDKIKTKLAETHYPTYQYEFVWENWRKK